MDPVVISSPSSEERFWNRLRDRVDAILEHRRPPNRCSSGAGISACKRPRGGDEEEDSLLLLRGFDSAAASLSQLTRTLGAAQQGLIDLAKPSSTEAQHRESQDASEADKDGLSNAKRRCVPDTLPTHDANAAQEESDSDNCEQAKQIPADVGKSANLNKAKNLAISMASKAAMLARELKMIKSQLCFMQERCALLEEENKRLRDGAEKGVRAEEDDLVRLQLEALLAEKSRLANANASLTRENECLHQLVEYHQLATQDLSPSYERELCGTRLDFSSPGLDHESDYTYSPSADELGNGNFQEQSPHV